MGIVRTVEWKLTCTAEEADVRFRQAFASLGMPSEGPAGDINSSAKRSLMKNRWSAEVHVGIQPANKGSIAVCRVDMLGTKHFALLGELAESLGEEVLDDRGLSIAVERLGKSSRLFGRKEVRHLRNLLYADEAVEELGVGEYQGKMSLIVLTDSRLFFFEKSLGSETVDEFPITSITSMSSEKKLTGETLIVYTSGNRAEIKSMKHGQSDALTRAFRKLKQATGSVVNAARSERNPDDAIAQLERLADLRDRGILSPAEFETKKAEIMGRI